MEIYLINILSLLLWQAIYLKMPKNNKSKLIIISLIFIQFVLIQGLRDFSIGIDTPKYMHYYDAFYHKDFVEMLRHPQYVFEMGYMILMYVCKNIGVPTRGFLFVTAILINYLFFRFIYKESDDFILSIWLFICLEYFTLSFTMLRQMIAMGFICNAYICLKDYKNIKFVILVLLAASFHKTALVFMIVPVIKYIYHLIDEKSKLGQYLVMNRYVIGVGSILLLILFKPLVAVIASKIYPDYSYASPSLGMLFFEICGIMFATMMCEHLVEDKTKLRYYQLFILISTCIQYSTTILYMINRLTLYFYVFSIVGIPYCIYCVKDKRLRNLIIIGTLIISFAQYYLVTMDMYNLVPYVLGDFAFL